MGTEGIEEGDDPLGECCGPEDPCAVQGSSGRKASAIAAVEDVETFAKAASGRFLARTLCDPLREGIGQVDGHLAEMGMLSLVGHCWGGEVHVVDLGPCKTSTPIAWEEAISNTAGGKLVIYTDGSRDDDGRVGGG